METNKTIQVYGTVTKTESLVEIKQNVLENTVVAEANNPYANYYGQIPQKPKPNSLFLFTSRIHFLEEILSAVESFDPFIKEKINVASATLIMQKQWFSAIRVKHFVHYKFIDLLQTNFQKAGIDFISKVNLSESALTKVQKCFVLKNIDNGIYLDMEEENEGYVTLKKKFTIDAFVKILNEIRNNTNYKLFDAAPVTINQNGNIKELARIYAEGIEVKFLENIKKGFERYSL